MNTMIAYAAGNSIQVTGSNPISCPSGINSLTDLINFFTCTLINSVVPLLVALAVAGFIWGVIKFFLNPENEEKKKDGKNFMFWGIFALFVMVSIWGLVGIFSSSFRGGGEPKLVIPSLNIGGK